MPRLCETTGAQIRQCIDLNEGFFKPKEKMRGKCVQSDLNGNGGGWPYDLYNLLRLTTAHMFIKELSPQTLLLP